VRVVVLAAPARVGHKQPSGYLQRENLGLITTRSDALDSLLSPGATTMHITFMRTGERAYALHCIYDDGAVLAVRTYDRPLGLAHDLTYYVVKIR
jgi:hypothetical protein